MQVLRALSATDIITAWEHGRDKHPIDRALLLLALACPSLAPSVLGNLSIGRRNTLLFDLRRKTLGTLANCFAICSRCESPLEFTMDITTLYTADMDEELSASTTLPLSTHTLTVENFEVCFRLPTSLDLAAIMSNSDDILSRRLLIERCVVHAEHDGQPIAVAYLPQKVLVGLAEGILEHDPQCEIDISLSCAECGHSWITLFDIVSFFWTELEVQAKRLLRDVAVLARAYGWHEADILALSVARRQFYLELVHR